METREILNYYKEKVNSRIKDLFDSEIEIFKKKDKKIAELIQHLKEFNLRGGKRIRAALSLIAYESFRGKDFNSMLDVAASIELMQSFFLIHDDVIDDDFFRRGGPSFHKIYENNKENLNPKLAEGIAIVAGDILEAYSKRIILKSKINKKIKILDKINEIIESTGYGEFLDVLSNSKKSLKEEEIIRIHTLKTAKYTIEGPLHLGAIAAGANENEIKILSDYAIPLGVAFQIKDDILGLFGDEEKIGKSAGSDVKEGKKTLLIIKAIEKSSQDDKEFINKCLANKDITKEEILKLREIVKKSGSLDYSKKLAEKLVSEAKKALEKSNINKEGKTFLFDIADFMIKRDC
jgi:geranylgeranyl diphosphate synthase type I